MLNEEQLLAELAEASAGLLFMSEDDHPFQSVCWKNQTEVTPQFLRRIANQSEDALVKTESLERFFAHAANEQAWHRPEDRETARKYQRLLRLFDENLENVKVYRVGERHIAAYIVGKNSEGSWVGLSTRLLET